jgi:hypothetical protein
MSWTADVFDFDTGHGNRQLRIEVSHEGQPVMWIFRNNGVVKIEYVGNGSGWTVDASWLMELLNRVEIDPSIQD